MSRTKIYIIIAAIIAIIAIILTQLNYENVYKANWSKNYKMDSKDPYGLWLFQSLINEKYGEENVLLLSELNYAEIDSSYDYLKIAANISYPSYQIDSIYELINKGMNSMFITKEFDQAFVENYIPNPYTKYQIDSSIHLSQAEGFDSTFKFKFRQQHINKSIPKSYATFENFESDKDSLSTNLLYVNHYGESAFIEYELGAGKVYHHAIPELFLNNASRNEDYLRHFNFVLGNLKADKLIMDDLRVSSANSNAKNPIEYILSQKSLKWAYGLMVSSILLFVLFQSKRKQKIIPVLQKNKNTSLEYVQTLSKLYEGQGQHSKLALKMEDIFLQRIKNRYYIDPSNKDFIKLVSLKSKIPKVDIENIMNRFESAHNKFNFTEDQLVALYNLLNSFYKNRN